MKKDIKKKILDSIKYAKEHGYTLVSEEWGSTEHKCACALGCVLMADSPENLDDTDAKRAVKAAELLGVTERWIDTFTEGFDGNGNSVDAAEHEAWDMGNAIAKEMKPIEYHKWDGNPA